MKLVINSNNYSDIRTAVFYKSHNYIPSCDIKEQDIQKFVTLCTSNYIQYQSSRNKLNDLDFSEYDFSYIIEKEKFNDTLKIDLCDNQSKIIFGQHVNDLEKIEKTLFPTISQETEGFKEIDPKTYSYFGTSLIQNQNFYMFNTSKNGLKNNFYKIELYENSCTSNNDSGKFIEYEFLKKVPSLFSITEIPVFTIYLGPGPLIKNNPDIYYLDYDPQLKLKNSLDPIDKIEYTKLIEEISMNNIICILLSKENNVININLSYKSWNDSINKNRNEKYYNLRNDDYFSLIDNINIFSSKDEFIVDKNSDTILSNRDIDDSPLYKNKLSRVNLRYYNPNNHYKKGDTVIYGNNPLNGKNYNWVSLTNNNIGNNPYISNKWIEESKIKDFNTNRIFLDILPENSGYIIPGNEITVLSKNMMAEFEVKEELGYKLDEKTPCIFEDRSPIKNAHLKILAENNKLIKKVYISDWSEFIKNKKNKMIFNLKPIKIPITLYASDKPDVSVSYNDWESYFGENNFKVSEIIYNNNNNNTLPEFDLDSNLLLKPNTEVSILFDNLKRISITKVFSIYYINNERKEKEIIPEYNIDKSKIILKDIINFSKAQYILDIIVKELTIYIDKFEGFTVSNVISKVKYEDNCSIGFYNNDNKEFDEIVINDLSNNITKILTISDLGKSIKLNSETLVEIKQDSLDHSLFNLVFTKNISNIKIQIK